MRTLKTTLTAVALTGLLAVLVPIWAVHRLVSGLLVRRPTGSRTPIERVAAADVDLDEVIAGSRPVVISGLVALTITPMMAARLLKPYFSHQFMVEFLDLVLCELNRKWNGETVSSKTINELITRLEPFYVQPERQRSS